MVAKKEIIVLNGGGHKGIVKISGVAGRTEFVKISCSLDFRPYGAKLYLIGDNIAQIDLKDTNCTVEVPFSAKNEIGCVLRSSSITMFGGSGAKSEMLKKIEAFNKEQRTVKETVKEIPAHAEPKMDELNVNEDNDEIKNAEEETISYETEEAGLDDCEAEQKETEKENRRQYAGVASKSNVNPLGEWTKYDGNNFYYAVKPQIDEMFICYPSEDLLATSVPNSKWVRVDAEDGYYVVGLLFDEDEPSYICYGVPEYQKNAKAPDELENMCVWLPLNSENMFGYWIIYQSAKTGEIIK